MVHVVLSCLIDPHIRKWRRINLTLVPLSNKEPFEVVTNGFMNGSKSLPMLHRSVINQK